MHQSTTTMALGAEDEGRASSRSGEPTNLLKDLLNLLPVTTTNKTNAASHRSQLNYMLWTGITPNTSKAILTLDLLLRGTYAPHPDQH